MKTLRTGLTISMSELKKHPSRVLRKAGQKPVAVLKQNKPAFYMVKPRLFEAMTEQLADVALMPRLKRRYAQRADAVAVNIDEI